MSHVAHSVIPWRSKLIPWSGSTKLRIVGVRPVRKFSNFLLFELFGVRAIRPFRCSDCSVFDGPYPWLHCRRQFVGLIFRMEVEKESEFSQTINLVVKYGVNSKRKHPGFAPIQKNSVWFMIIHVQSRSFIHGHSKVNSKFIVKFISIFRQRANILFQPIVRTEVGPI